MSLEVRSALVIGAARSGVAAARALAARGVPVRLHDARSQLDPEVPAIVELALGVREPATLLADVDLVVRSPGVPAASPVLVAARAAGIAVWSEVELGYRLLPAGCYLIGITGTNGKTTVTELVGAMVRASGLPVALAGNVGVALTGVAETASQGTIIVCELSSFQLEDVHELRCDAAALLNLTPDHLARHGTLEEYGRCKLRIFERQRAADVAVLNGDDPWVAALPALPGAGQRVVTHGRDAEAIGFAGSRLVGDHNRENVAVAVALARAVGVPELAIVAGLASFAPVAHRLEHVATIDGVTYWNDSKATNVDATLKALTAFAPGAVRLILGGSDKGADFAPLAAPVRAAAASVYLVGPAGERMLALSFGTPASFLGTLAAAVAAASRDALVGDAVLLSPACASFDEFSDYAARGEAFRRLVEARSHPTRPLRRGLG